MLKKQMIMEKALKLFARQGFEATSVQQITEHCGISKGAFYLSFKSKHELIYSLIDHFMKQHTTNLDQLVKSSNFKDNDELLYKFYQTSYHFFINHIDFSTFFMKEIQTLNDELIEKLSYYDRLQEEIILSLVERIYGENVKHSKYDLLYCIKSFMVMYVNIILFRNKQLDIQLLSKSLVEKTNILANEMKLPLLTRNHLDHLDNEKNKELKKNDLAKVIEEKIEEISDSIENESLTLLLQNLHEDHLPAAIVKGLIENIRQHEDCKWIAYLLLNYYEF